MRSERSDEDLGVIQVTEEGGQKHFKKVQTANNLFRVP